MKKSKTPVTDTPEPEQIYHDPNDPNYDPRVDPDVGPHDPDNDYLPE